MAPVLTAPSYRLISRKWGLGLDAPGATDAPNDERHLDKPELPDDDLCVDYRGAFYDAPGRHAVKLSGADLETGRSGGAGT